MSPIIRLDGASMEERLRYGLMVKAARTGMKLSQAELADAARVSTKTVSNIERGTHAAQEDVLRRIFTVVGIQTTDDQHSNDIINFMEMYGTMLEFIPTERRLDIQNRVMSIVAEEIKQSAAAERTAAVTPLFADADKEDDWEAEDAMGYAAKKKSSAEELDTDSV